MNTLDILMRICEKRDEFLAKGQDAQNALTKAMYAIAEEYCISLTSLTKLVTL